MLGHHAASIEPAVVAAVGSDVSRLPRLLCCVGKARGMRAEPSLYEGQDGSTTRCWAWFFKPLDVAHPVSVPLVPLGVPGTMCDGVQLLRLVHFSLPLARIDAGHRGRCRQSRLAERGWSCAWRQSSGGRLESPWDRTFHPELTG